MPSYHVTVDLTVDAQSAEEARQVVARFHALAFDNDEVHTLPLAIDDVICEEDDADVLPPEGIA